MVEHPPQERLDGFAALARTARMRSVEQRRWIALLPVAFEPVVHASPRHAQMFGHLIGTLAFGQRLHGSEPSLRPIATHVLSLLLQPATLPAIQRHALVVHRPLPSYSRGYHGLLNCANNYGYLLRW
jgi:hypothetical protein